MLAHADAFRVIAIGSKRRGTTGTDHFVATLVPFFLFAQTFAQRFHEFFPTAHGFYLLFFFFTQVQHGLQLQPFSRYFRHNGVNYGFHALEMCTEDSIKAVKQAFIFYQAGTGEIIKLVNIKRGNVLVDCAQQAQVFSYRNRQTTLAEFMK